MAKNKTAKAKKAAVKQKTKVSKPEGPADDLLGLTPEEDDLLGPAPKPEAPKPEAPKPEEPKPEEPKPEEPKPEEPKPEEPKPKADRMGHDVDIETPNGAKFKGRCVSQRTTNDGEQVFLQLNGCVSRWFSCADIVE